MNESNTNLDQLQSILSEQGSDLSNPFGPLIETITPLIGTIVIVSIGLSILLVIILLINTIQKHRTHAAILRIDKNIQKLVDINTRDTSKSAHTPEQ